MEAIGLWEVAKSDLVDGLNGMHYFDSKEDASAYFEEYKNGQDKIRLVTVYKELYGKPMVIERIDSSGQACYLKLQLDGIEIYSREDQRWTTTKCNMADYQDMYDAFKVRGIDIIDGSKYTLFYYDGFVYDYSKEALAYLSRFSGVYRIDYYSELDGVKDVISCSHMIWPQSKKYIYRNGILGYYTFRSQEKAKAFIDAQYLKVDDIDKWYGVLEGKDSCIQVSEKTINSQSVFMLQSGFIATPINLVKHGMPRRRVRKGLGGVNV